MEKVLITEKQSFKYSLKKKIHASRFLILMIIPAIIYYVVFCYIPMYGILISFTYYSPSLGIMGSVFNNWVGFDNFLRIFKQENFWKVIGNTVLIGGLKIIISFVSAIFVALLINEIRMKFFKKVVQVIVTFPHFLSWVIVASLFIMMLDDSGVFNHVITQSGGEPIPFLYDRNMFLTVIFSSDVWKEAGWSSIIYIATMAGISPELYEAADIDGATRLQKIWHITLPGIKATAILLLIMSVGGVLSAGFDQIYNMTGMLNNPIITSVDVLDTYIYRYMSKVNFGVTSAIGLFKSVIGFILVIVTDRIAKACGERGII